MKKIIGLIAVLFSLGGCAQTQLAAHAIKQIPFPDDPPKTQGKFKVGNPYKIMGKAYFPKESYNLVETGIASWYGPNFDGKPTANGEIFDKNALTAAHRTLQMPSLVRVTNLDNGRSLILRINDRGPFSRGRILDVSERGAELLGFKNAGTAKIKLEVLTEESKVVAAIAKKGKSTAGTEIAMNRNGYLPASYNVASVARTAKNIMPASASAPKTLSPQPMLKTASIGGDKAVKVRSSAVKPVAEVESLEPMKPGVYNASYSPADNKTLKPQPLKPQKLAANQPTRLSSEVSDAGEELVKKVPVAPSNIYVQAGSFTNQGNALAMKDILASNYSTQVMPATINGQNFYRVRVGPLNNVDNADQILAAVVDQGYENAMIIVD